MIYLVLALLVAAFVGGVVLANRVRAELKALHARLDALEQTLRLP